MRERRCQYRQFTVAVRSLEDLTGEDRSPELANEIYEKLIEQLSAVEGLYALGDESTKGFSDTG